MWFPLDPLFSMLLPFVSLQEVVMITLEKWETD
jgi:hypothetical protein